MQAFIDVSTTHDGDPRLRPFDLPRTNVDPDELRRSPEYAQLRAEVGRAVNAAAA